MWASTSSWHLHDVYMTSSWRLHEEFISGFTLFRCPVVIMKGSWSPQSAGVVSMKSRWSPHEESCTPRPVGYTGHIWLHVIEIQSMNHMLHFDYIWYLSWPLRLNIGLIKDKRNWNFSTYTISLTYQISYRIVWMSSPALEDLHCICHDYISVSLLQWIWTDVSSVRHATALTCPRSMNMKDSSNIAISHYHCKGCKNNLFRS